MTSQPRILMCPPDHYGIEYEINPWMNRSLGAVRSLAFAQWRRLHDALERLGVRIEILEPRPGLPDLVFTANAGLVYRDRFFSSSFRHEVRARESPYFDAWFADHGFEVIHLPEGMYFEGAGDALFCGDELFAGYRIRSDAQAHQWVGAELGVRVLPLELVNPRFYHLDTCFCPLAPGEALYYPGAFDEYGRRVLETHIPTLLP
ncbi:MAG TPA: arginine deiminase-related protein, partial [Gemmataceae bacterium]